MAETSPLLRVSVGESVGNGVALVTIDHPPIQLVDGEFIAALAQLRPSLEADERVRVVVFVSDDPDFFLMHGDVHSISAACGRAPVPGVNPAAAIFDTWRTSPLVSIGVLEGAARGGGAEFFTALDLRLAGATAILGQPEVALGLIPGAGGTARLGRLLGRSQALRLILTGEDVDAQRAYELGWVDEVVTAGAVRDRALQLARRIAAMPTEAVAALKQVMDVAIGDFAAGLTAESEANSQLMADRIPVAPISRFIAAGGQAREAERGDFAAVVDSTLRSDPAGGAAMPTGAA
jgi:enoyl-CoA hydratase/carnithine racemase